MIDERITKKQVLEIYKIDSSTLENWIRLRGFPMIEISSHKKYVRLKDLKTFEDKMILKNKLNSLQMENKIKNINRIIHLLNKHILVILTKKNVDDDKLSVLTDIRILYIEELDGLVRSQNTRDMFDKEYWKSYKQTKF